MKGAVSVRSMTGGEDPEGRTPGGVGDRAGASASGGRAPREAPLSRRLQTGLWLLLVVFAFHGVFGHSLWGANDSREGGMIWDMYRHGTWVTPTINGQPFLEKPPLLHWTALAFCHIAGRVTEGLVRLPAALYGFGTLVLIYLFVAGAGDPRGRAAPTASRQLAAWAAAFACGTAVEFHEYSRIVLTDMALTFVVTLSLYLFWRAWCRPATGRWLLFLVAAAAAFYGKGLIGPALIWSAVAIFLLWKRRFRLLVALSAAYVPLLPALVLPWGYALYKFAGVAAVRFAFWDNQIGRFFLFGDPTLPHDPFFINKEPPYYYLLHLPGYLAPWTLLLVPALVAWWRRASVFREEFHTFVTCSLAGMFLVLHASSAKVVNYALPTYPFLFMMVGIWLVHVGSPPRPAWLDRWCIRLTAWGVGAVVALVSVAFVVGTFARPDLFRTGGPASLAASLLGAVLLLGVVVVLSVVLRRVARSPARPMAFGLAPAAFAVVSMGVLQLVTPPIERGRSWKPVAALAAEEIREGRAIALAEDVERDVGAFTFYLDRRLAILKEGKDVATYLSAPEPRAVITPAEALPSIEAQLTSVPHARLVAGDPGTLSRSFALLVNRPVEEAAGVGADPLQPGKKVRPKVAVER